MLEQQLAPGRIAEALEVRGRIHDIGEEQRGERAISVGRSGVEAGAGELECLERFVSDNPGVMTGREVVHVVNSNLQHVARVGFDMELPAEDNALMVDFAGASAGDRTDVAGPPPSGLEGEAANCGFIVADGFYPAVRKTADFFRIAKALCLGARHVRSA